MEEQDQRQNKLEELKEQYLKQREAAEKELDTQAKMQSVLRRFLNEDAMARLGNVKLVNKELYMKAFQSIMSLAQRGYVKEKLNDGEVKQILLQLKGNREINIKRK
ncbi:MAG TPA: hypothetical protein HA254_03355 [Candidatus Diapherotrites archaeon]|uniref:DNA-binding protein n=1 Tax=Candidatus Iainarchaeum sp. TaxID=3101447 RepID=A0A7J4IZH1_9ARCH|nr:hypothetical protein [Candidatus Diapherotrites archaeon]